jgi:hypothetical protein
LMLCERVRAANAQVDQPIFHDLRHRPVILLSGKTRRPRPDDAGLAPNPCGGVTTSMRYMASGFGGRRTSARWRRSDDHNCTA